MYFKKFTDCQSFVMRGKKDPAIEVKIIEMFRPTDGFDLSYNVAQFSVPQGKRTDQYALRSSTELWFIKEGQGIAEVDGKAVELNNESLVFIKPGQKRKLTNTGQGLLVYHSIAEPPFKPENVESFEECDIEMIKH